MLSKSSLCLSTLQKYFYKLIKSLDINKIILFFGEISLKINKKSSIKHIILELLKKKIINFF